MNSCKQKFRSPSLRKNHLHFKRHVNAGISYSACTILPLWHFFFKENRVIKDLPSQLCVKFNYSPLQTMIFFLAPIRYGGLFSLTSLRSLYMYTYLFLERLSSSFSNLLWRLAKCVQACFSSQLHRLTVSFSSLLLRLTTFF